MGGSVLREIDVQIDGCRLVGYRTDGDPPALLLHGGPALPYTYLDSLVDELDGLVGAISYQQRGLAPSAVGGAYLVRSHVDDAVGLLDALGLDRAWMIGHSWGGYLAMAIAALAPERTLGWIAIDPLGLTGDGGMEELGTWLGRDLSPDQHARLEELEAEESETDGDVEVEAASLAVVWPNYFADPGTAAPFPGMRFNPYAYERSVADALSLNASGELVRDLVAGGRPGVVIAGSESGLRRAAEETAEAAGAPSVAVERSGHFPWLEVPGSVREVVASTIAVPSASTG
ncbi:MAG: alpha/beta fold hydrolase [Actinomycetota bacterium]